jgi:hypothetical protein
MNGPPVSLDAIINTIPIANGRGFCVDIALVCTNAAVTLEVDDDVHFLLSNVGWLGSGSHH